MILSKEQIVFPQADSFISRFQTALKALVIFLFCLVFSLGLRIIPLRTISLGVFYSSKAIYCPGHQFFFNCCFLFPLSQHRHSTANCSCSSRAPLRAWAQTRAGKGLTPLSVGMLKHGLTPLCFSELNCRRKLISFKTNRSFSQIEDCMAHGNFSQNLTHFCLTGDFTGD